MPLAEARLAAVETIARLALEHKVDAVLVAGDVFDAQTVADRTIRKLFNALRGFPGPWIMIPGNHDAALTESVWTRASRLGATGQPTQQISPSRRRAEFTEVYQMQADFATKVDAAFNKMLGNALHTSIVPV